MITCFGKSPTTAVAVADSTKNKPLFARGQYQKIDGQLLAGQKKNGLIVSVESPDEIYVQVNDFVVEFRELLTDMNNFYGELPANELKLNDFNKGMPCAARSEDDEVWYRGQVTAYLVKQRMVAVFFVDYGNQEFLPCDEVKFLKPEFFGLPAICVRCRFAGLPPQNVENNVPTYRWSPELRQSLKNLIGEPMTINFKTFSADGNVWEVDMTNKNVEKFLNSILQPEPEAVVNGDAKPNLPTIFLPNGFDAPIIRSDEVYAIYLGENGYVSLEEVCLKFWNLLHSLTLLETELPKIYVGAIKNKLLPRFADRHLGVGVGCVAKIQDGFFRCEIQETQNSKNECLLLRVDYGDKYFVNTDDIFPVVDNELIKTHRFAVLCRVKDVKMPAGFREIKQLQEKFPDMIQPDKSECRFFGYDENGRLLAEIYLKDSNGQTVASFLHQLGLVAYAITKPAKLLPSEKDELPTSSVVKSPVPGPRPPFPASPPPSSSVFTNGSASAAAPLENASKSETSLSIVGLPVLNVVCGQSSFLDVTIVHEEGPGKFFVCLANLFTEFVEMENELSKVYANEDEHSPLVNPISGDLGAYRSSDKSDKWYRCQVVERSSIAIADVYLVDYGRVEKISKNSLKFLEDQFRRLPPMALQCSLMNVPIIERTNDYFAEFVRRRNGPYTIKLENKTDDGFGFQVTMYVDNERGGERNLNEDLANLPPPRFNNRPTSTSSSGGRYDQPLYNVRERRNQRNADKYH